MTVQQFVERTQPLLEHERKCEIEATRGLLRSHTDKELEKKGIVLVNLKVVSKTITPFNEMEVVFRHTIRNKELPHSSLALGAVVGIFTGPFQGKAIANGVVARQTMSEITVIVGDQVVGSTLNSSQIYKLGPDDNDSTHNRMLVALDTLRKNAHRMIKIMFDSPPVKRQLSPPAVDHSMEPFTDAYSRLNAAQQVAVRGALQAEVLTVIHGPPGTGKTKTLCVTILEHFARNPNMRILICAPSNVGVDNLALGIMQLSKSTEKMVRLGNPIQVDRIVRENIGIDRLTRKGSFGPVAERARKRMNRLLMNHDTGALNEIGLIKDELKLEEKRAVTETLQGCRIFFATCAGAAYIKRNIDLGPRYKFDLCIVDECAQGLEIVSWIPILESIKNCHSWRSSPITPHCSLWPQGAPAESL
jgi:hypothetical protein